MNTRTIHEWLVHAKPTPADKILRRDPAGCVVTEEDGAITVNIRQESVGLDPDGAAELGECLIKAAEIARKEEPD